MMRNLDAKVQGVGFLYGRGMNKGSSLKDFFKKKNSYRRKERFEEKTKNRKSSNINN